MIRYILRTAVEALNRRDFEAAFLFVPPEYETVTFPELVGLGFEPTYLGRDQRIRYHRRWVDELGEFQHEPGELIDCGDRLVLLARIKGTGRTSGAIFESEVAYVMTISGGRLIREHDFRSHEQALEAAGLSE